MKLNYFTHWLKKDTFKYHKNYRDASHDEHKRRCTAAKARRKRKKKNKAKKR